MKRYILSFLTILTLGNQSLEAKLIKAICFDVATIFTTNKLRASSYIGKINSIRYITQTGHTPSQEDLFRQLALYKAISTTKTYTDNMETPLILSDWLSQAQAAGTIKKNLNTYLGQRPISDIEKQVLCAIINMMMTPEYLVDTQKTYSYVEKLLKILRSKGYKLYLTGNWCDIKTLKIAFPEIFSLFDKTFVSGELRSIKPSPEYYEQLTQHLGINKDAILWLEAQPKMAHAGKAQGLEVAAYNPDKKEELIATLKRYGIFIEL